MEHASWLGNKTGMKCMNVSARMGGKGTTVSANQLIHSACKYVRKVTKTMTATMELHVHSAPKEAIALGDSIHRLLCVYLAALAASHRRVRCHQNA